MIKKRTILFVASRATINLDVKDTVGIIVQKRVLSDGDEVTVSPKDDEQYFCSLTGETSLFTVKKEMVDKLLLNDELLEERGSSEIKNQSTTFEGLPDHGWKHFGKQ